jgi:hypothetical protein
MSEALFGLVGALIGAAAAVGGQMVVRRRQERERWVGVLLEECARIYMLEDGFASAVWEATFGAPRNPGRLADWSRSDRAMASARLTIVCSDDDLLASAEALTRTGKALWHVAQTGSKDEWNEARDRHARGLADFVARARTAARDGRTI